MIKEAPQILVQVNAVPLIAATNLQIIIIMFVQSLDIVGGELLKAIVCDDLIN